MVAELEGARLDFWVAKAAGYVVYKDRQGPGAVTWVADGDRSLGYIDFGGTGGLKWKPSSDWAKGGPIIEREKISIHCDVQDYSEPESPWYAECGPSWDIGPAPLIAAMRAYVASKFGEEVPDESV